MSHKSNATCLLSSLSLLFVLFWLPATAQYEFSGLSTDLQRNQKALGNGVVSVIYKDTIVYKKELGEDFTAKSSVPIGTGSQWIAVATIMTFVDQGKLDLDDPVSKYLPIFTKYAKGYLTIRHCLSSTTGIESEKGKLGKLLGGKKKYATLEEEVNAIAGKEIHNNPEKEFHYGLMGINVAARVVEVIGKKSFDRLVQERITRPLRMRGTSFTDENGGAINPSSGARSSANDLINFLTMIVNDGKFEGKQVISEKSLAEMQKAQFVGLPVSFRPAEATNFEYGLGVWIIEKDGEGKTTSIGLPSSNGSFFLVDKCRKYAAVMLAKKAGDDIPQKTYIDFKAAIDAQIKSGCN